MTDVIVDFICREEERDPYLLHRDLRLGQVPGFTPDPESPSTWLRRYRAQGANAGEVVRSKIWHALTEGYAAAVEIRIIAQLPNASADRRALHSAAPNRTDVRSGSAVVSGIPAISSLIEQDDVLVVPGRCLIRGGIGWSEGPEKKERQYVRLPNA